MDALAEPPLYTGACGWSYDDWTGSVYPAGTPSHDYLARYAAVFNAVEIDSTRYAVPPVERVRRWARAVPADFRFAAKAPRTITHERALNGTDDDERLFLDTMRELGDKLAAVLFQFPAAFGAPEHDGALNAFLDRLPRDVPVVLEFRRARLLTPAAVSAFVAAGASVALCDGTHPRPDADTFAGPVAYIRLLGDRARIEREMVRRYGAVRQGRIVDGFEKDLALRLWAARIRNLRRPSRPAEALVRAVYVFANNYFEGTAPETLRKLAQALDVLPPPLLLRQRPLFAL